MEITTTIIKLIQPAQPNISDISLDSCTKGNLVLLHNCSNVTSLVKDSVGMWIRTSTHTHSSTNTASQYQQTNRHLSNRTQFLSIGAHFVELQMLICLQFQSGGAARSSTTSLHSEEQQLSHNGPTMGR